MSIRLLNNAIPSCTNVNPSYVNVNPSYVNVNPSYVNVNPSSNKVIHNNVNQPSFNVNPSCDKVNPSLNNVNPSSVVLFRFSRRAWIWHQIIHRGGSGRISTAVDFGEYCPSGLAIAPSEVMKTDRTDDGVCVQISVLKIVKGKIIPTNFNRDEWTVVEFHTTTNDGCCWLSSTTTRRRRMEEGRRGTEDVDATTK